MLSWSAPRGWRSDNPCLLVPKLKGGAGYEPPREAIEHARVHLRPDLWHAMALGLYTGQRRGDVLAMRWDHVSEGMISVAQEKTAKRLLIPLHSELRAILSMIEKRAVTILTSTAGTPWAKDGFKASWQKDFVGPLSSIRKAGLVFHGLRKSAVVFLLEAGPRMRKWRP
jgi:integrase